MILYILWEKGNKVKISLESQGLDGLEGKNFLFACSKI